jgi:cell division protein FtsL
MSRLTMPKLHLHGPFTSLEFTKQVITLFVLGAIVIAQALGVIYTKQSRRLLHAKLQSLYAARDRLQVEWSKLLLEQGTWQAEARVEKIAREQLGMVMPDKTQLITP